jgi:hypothetical protein
MTNLDFGQAGFVGQPESELDVAYLLGLAQEHLPFSLVVTAINDTFPDCEGIDSKTGKRITIELEVHSRNYLGHGHPLKLADGSLACDYIVCWEDNWQESPIPVISLRRLFESAPLRHRLVYQPRPYSLRGQLQVVQATDPHAYEAVIHFIDVALAELRRRIPACVVDETLTKHFSVRYGSGKGLLGVYPSGRLVSAGIGDMVKTYGDIVAEPTQSLRRAVQSVSVLRTREDAAPVVAALERVMGAIKDSQSASFA